MNAHVLLQQSQSGTAALGALLSGCSAGQLAELVEQIKAEADRHWWIDASRSLAFADLLMQIGRVCDNPRYLGLGMMARGDALNYIGRQQDAWEMLEQAGATFLQAGDEVGWARTRIGRLNMCVDLNQVGPALADAQRARAILTRYGVLERRLRLDLNTAIVYNLIGDQHAALRLYHATVSDAEALGPAGQGILRLLYNCIGNAYNVLGDFRQAAAYYERAIAQFMAYDETRAIAVAEQNIAHLEMAQGHYRRALQLLHQAHDRLHGSQFELDAAHIERDTVECYLALSRYDAARDLAQRVIATYQALGAGYRAALTLVHLATAEAELANFAAALTALDAAEAIFGSLHAQTWAATVRLRRGQIALQQGDLALAAHEARAAAGSFASAEQAVSLATAVLLEGQALLASSDCGGAAQAARRALALARQCNLPQLRYSAHLLLGRVAEAERQAGLAARRYFAAVATVERVQRGLTITMRPGFLENRGDALQALIGLQLRAGQAGRAFETLERAKSQVLLHYLANREQLHWSSDDARSRALLAELNQLRDEHQWFYRIAHELPAQGQAQPRAINPAVARAELAGRERQMRALTEQLYLRSAADPGAAVALPRLADVQRALDDQTLLVEFYNDGAHWWAFTLDSASLELHQLPAQPAAIDGLLAQLQVNLAGALNAGPAAPLTRNLTSLAQRILGRLHGALLEPLAARLAGRQRLVVVPYGALHYLPFHLLYDGAAYLIERREVTVLPAAGLAARRSPLRPHGAHVLAHSWGGRLPQTLVEADLVGRVFGAQVAAEGAATRAALRRRPAQVLHIAAHGEHRLDQPDLSYIQLADGQLYADDLLQHDLSYELVVLSACETGRANVAGCDELIGLGRGFLYAGAGALITSLWRVADDMAGGLMERLYAALVCGESKAAALRAAQRAALGAAPGLHPAFWGAFQLVGDPAPLSTARGPDRAANRSHAPPRLGQYAEMLTV